MILNWELFIEGLVGELPISDIDSYINSMNKSIKDKLFFSDIINYDIIVDFGCGDGTFLKNISDINSNIKLIGYDLDENMLAKAKSKLKKSVFTDDWYEVLNNIQLFKSPLLNLSSVIHEVYSYSHGSIVKKFWEEQVFGGDFKYITIRDMIPSTSIDKNEISQFKDDAKKIRIKSDKKYLNSFENKWGSINTNYRTLTHWLLKYRYTDNWEREVNENYLPITLETLKTKIPKNYKIIYEDNFVEPFLKQKVKNDFGIILTHPTHTKMIIKKI